MSPSRGVCATPSRIAATGTGAPRSISIHWGAKSPAIQRLVGSPSTAFVAGVVACSAEAVTVRGARLDGPPAAAGLEGPPPAAVLEAAARIGVRVLQPVTDAFDAARDLERRWSPDLAELRYNEPGAAPAGSVAPITRVPL